MVLTFDNDYLEDLYSGKSVKGKPKFSENVIIKFKKTVNQLKNAEDSSELRSFGGLNFEALKGDRKGKYSVRVNNQYRLIFRIEKDLVVVEQIVIEELSNHYS
jgi:proteic killer suppression protein